MTKPITPRERAENAAKEYFPDDLALPGNLASIIECAILADRAAERERLTASVDVEGMRQEIERVMFGSNFDKAGLFDLSHVARFVAEREAAKDQRIAELENQLARDD